MVRSGTASWGSGWGHVRDRYRATAGDADFDDDDFIEEEEEEEEEEKEEEREEGGRRGK